MKEIETLVQVLEDKNSALAKLGKFEFKGAKKMKDIYFYDPLRESLKHGDNEAPSETFRLRDNGGECLMTYKIDTFHEDGAWSYSEEHETGVSSDAEARHILRYLGLEPLVEVETERSKFIHDGYEIVLDDIKGLGLFMEVEKLNVGEREDLDLIKATMWNFVKSLGIKITEELFTGKPEMMLRKLGKLR